MRQFCRVERQICRKLRSVNVENYNRRVIRAFERAQARSGARSAAAFARELAARGGGSPDASTYQRWLRGDSLAPAWALVAAAETAGESLDALLGFAADDRLAHLEQRMADLEAALQGGSGNRAGDNWLDNVEEQSRAHRDALEEGTAAERRRPARGD
jgi:hypothetical protein